LFPPTNSSFPLFLLLLLFVSSYEEEIHFEFNSAQITRSLPVHYASANKLNVAIYVLGMRFFSFSTFWNVVHLNKSARASAWNISSPPLLPSVSLS
jgi:hypothetical protein